jgi:hypothetical protein
MLKKEGQHQESSERGNIFFIGSKKIGGIENSSSNLPNGIHTKIESK